MPRSDLAIGDSCCASAVSRNRNTLNAGVTVKATTMDDSSARTKEMANGWKNAPSMPSMKKAGTAANTVMAVP